MQAPSSRTSKIIFISLAAGGAVVIAKLVYDFIKNLKMKPLKIKTIVMDGKRVIVRKDLIKILQKIREMSQEQVCKTITHYRSLRRRSVENEYDYEELINAMRSQLETQINEVCNDVLQECGASQVLFERSIEFFNDREIQQLIGEMAVIKKNTEEVKLSRSQLLELFSFYEKIQKSILDSTDIQAFDSKILRYQIEDKIWQEFGIEINDIDWTKTNYASDANLMNKMHEISQYMASIQKLNKSLLS